MKRVVQLVVRGLKLEIFVDVMSLPGVSTGVIREITWMSAALCPDAIAYFMDEGIECHKLLQGWEELQPPQYINTKNIMLILGVKTFIARVIVVSNLFFLF